MDAWTLCAFRRILTTSVTGLVVIACALDVTALDSGECAPTLKACNGTCVRRDNTDTHCGQPSCLPCLLAHATPLCSATGACDIARCDVGYADCNATGQDGCETDIAADANHCGGCTPTPCTTPHASPGCSGGVCVILACETNFADCNHRASDGCEADLTADASCGACGSACTSTQKCTGGKCT